MRVAGKDAFGGVGGRCEICLRGRLVRDRGEDYAEGSAYRRRDLSRF